MLYSFILLAGSVIARTIALFDKKTANFFLLRKGEIGRVADYFNDRRNRKNKVIWFHAASAGEFEQAKPIIEHIRSTIKNAQIIASFFSPSGYKAGLKYNKIDFCFNLPLDFRKNMIKLLDHINPHIIIYSKYDVWLNLTIEAHKRRVKLVLINGTLPEKSYRHKFPVRFFFRKAYSLLIKIYAISGIDALRFKKMTGKDNNIIISGDTRFDRIKTVIGNTRRKKGKITAKEKGGVYLIAGSTYKKSEGILIRIIKELNDKKNPVRLILVPHEINPHNIRRLKRLISSYGFIPVSYSAAAHPVPLIDNEILIVDVFGILAALYNEADIVFIGGSFKGSVHSVLEPAIFGKPILTGPYIDNSYEALALNEIGGLKLCKNREYLHQEILRLALDNKYRNKISKIAKTFFYNNTGATKFILKDLYRIL